MRRLASSTPTAVAARGDQAQPRVLVCPVGSTVIVAAPARRLRTDGCLLRRHQDNDCDAAGTTTQPDTQHGAIEASLTHGPAGVARSTRTARRGGGAGNLTTARGLTGSKSFVEATATGNVSMAAGS
jgi:hypothetical protein